MKKLLALLLLCCGGNMIGADASAYEVPPLFPAEKWYTLPEYKEQIEEIIALRNRLVVPHPDGGVGSIFPLYDVIARNREDNLSTTDYDLLYSDAVDYTVRQRWNKRMKDVLFNPISKVRNYLVNTVPWESYDAFVRFFSENPYGHSWLAQSTEWQNITEQDVVWLGQNLRNSFPGYTEQSWKDLYSNLKNLEEAVRPFMLAMQIRLNRKDTVFGLESGTLWAPPYGVKTLAQIAAANSAGEEYLDDKTRKARAILTRLVDAYPAGIDHGAAQGYGHERRYDFSVLKAWFKKIIINFHPDKAENIAALKTSRYNHLFGEMKAVGEDLLRSAGLTPYKHYKIPFVSPSDDEQAAATAQVAQLYIQALYDNAQHGQNVTADTVQDLVAKISSLDEALFAGCYDLTRNWTLSYEGVERLVSPLSAIVGIAERLPNVGIKERGSLDKYITTVKNIYNYFNNYKIIVVSMVDIGSEKEKSESLLEVAGEIIKRDLSRQDEMRQSLDAIIRPTGSFATDYLKKAMNQLQGIFNFFSAGQGILKMRQVHAFLSSDADPDQKAYTLYHVFGIGHDVPDFDDMSFFTYKQLLNYMKVLEKILITRMVSPINVTLKDQVARNYSDAWKKNDGSLWASKEAFEKDLSAFVQCLQSVYNLLLGYCQLIFQGSLPTIIREKDGAPMPVVKDVSPAVAQQVKQCAADAKLLKVIGSLGKAENGNRLVSESSTFNNFYKTYIYTDKWGINFLGDLNAGTMIVEPRLQSVKRIAGEFLAAIQDQLGVQAQFFEFFVNNFVACADAYAALPPATGDTHDAGHTGGSEGAPSQGASHGAHGASGDYTMPAHVAQALIAAQAKYVALSGFDWDHAGAMLRRMNMQLYKKFEDQVEFIKQGQPVTISVEDVQSKGLAKVGSNVEVKAWLEAWRQLLEAVANPSAASGGAASTEPVKTLRSLIDLNLTLHAAAAA